jgi:pyruvate/2-oxoglutarate/acetoin dehydrogenase E1 component
MAYLARNPHIVFMGQAVEFPGTAMTTTLPPAAQKIELPVAEEMQMGMAIGMSLAGFIPVTIYPRWNFLLLAMNQLVNHLDKLPLMSELGCGYQPKVIIRTSIGSERPLHPQSQHVGDFTDAARSMLSTVEVIRLDEPSDIFPAYKKALERTDGRSTLLVEWGDYYSEK